MAYEQLVFRVHALQRMFRRGISEADVKQVLETGEAIEDYPEDRPYPSRLILGFTAGHPIQIVVADNHQAQETIVIIVYEPDPKRWDATFRRRRAQ